MSSGHQQKNPFRPAPAETNSSGKVPTKPIPPKNGHKRGHKQNIDCKFSSTSNQYLTCITSSIALSRSLQTILNVEDSQKPERVQAQVAGMEVLMYAVYCIISIKCSVIVVLKVATFWSLFDTTFHLLLAFWQENDVKVKIKVVEKWPKSGIMKPTPKKKLQKEVKSRSFLLLSGIGESRQCLRSVLRHSISLAALSSWVGSLW